MTARTQAKLLSLFTALMLLCPAICSAVSVQDLVRIKGAEQNRLVGMGLVVGLPGTGDGGKFAPTSRPLANVIARFMDESVNAAELKDSRNVALVTVEAIITSSGAAEGDRVDVRISAIGPAKSLQGGQLFMTPLTGPLPDSPVYAYASGKLLQEDLTSPTTAIVRRGAQLVRSIRPQYVSPDGKITMVLNDDVATIPMAQTIASIVNGRLAPDGPNVAHAVDQKHVVIDVPVFQRKDPVAYLSPVLLDYIDPDLIDVGARVVINDSTGTIVIKGDVQISPVVISHENLTITTITPPVSPPPVLPDGSPLPPGEQSFIGLDPEHRGGTRLVELLSAFNQLKVPARDRIAILRRMKESGALHAQLIEE
jgi:flagellar P-ring protein precursor FlgI